MDNHGDKIAVVGTFDGVHLGHTYLLETLKHKAAVSGRIPVVVTFSGHPLETIRPDRVPSLLTTPEEKISAIKSLGINDIIILDFNEQLRNMSAADFMVMLKECFAVDTLLLGYDTVFGHDRPEGLDAYQAIGDKTGLKVEQCQEYIVDGIQVSSSKIRKALTEGNIELANRLIGKPYSITGKVVDGKKLGRKIGFPTANIEPLHSRQLIPQPGVYAADVELPDGSVKRAMLNVGYRPTVDNSAAPKLTLEAHLFDFNEDIYSAEIRIAFLRRIRSEKKFNGIEELRAQLTADAEEARR